MNDLRSKILLIVIFFYFANYLVYKRRRDVKRSSIIAWKFSKTTLSTPTPSARWASNVCCCLFSSTHALTSYDSSMWRTLDIWSSVWKKSSINTSVKSLRNSCWINRVAMIRWPWCTRSWKKKLWPRSPLQLSWLSCRNRLLGESWQLQFQSKFFTFNRRYISKTYLHYIFYYNNNSQEWKYRKLLYNTLIIQMIRRLPFV